MPHGTPDWGLVGPKSTVYGLDDLGEHAVRMGSPSTWDRRGDVTFATDFRHGIGDMVIWCLGAGCVATLHAGAARQGAYCVKLTAGRDDIRSAGIRKRLPYLVASNLGVECSFGFHPDTDYVQLEGYLQDANGLWEPTLRLYPNTGVLQVRTAPAGAYVQVSATANVHLDVDCINTIKMVFNRHRVLGVYTGYYVRAIVNSVAYPIDTHPIFFTPGVLEYRAMFEFRHYGTFGNNPEGFADNFIVTQNEP